MRTALALLLAAAVAAAAFLALPSQEKEQEENPTAPSRGGAEAPAPSAPVLLGQGTARTVGPDAGRGDASFEGLVVDEVGAPVADVRVEVRLVAKDPRSGRGWQVTAFAPPPEPPAPLAADVSDESGRVRLTGLPHGAFVRVLAAPLAPRTGLHRVIRLRGEATTPIRLVVLEGAALHGRLVDEEGRGLPGWIAAHLPHGDSRLRADGSNWVWFPRTTDGDGGFLIPSAPRGLVHVNACVPGRGALSCVPAEVPGAAVVLCPIHADDARVVGTVSTAGGEPVAGARVRAGVARDDAGGDAWGLATTATDGTYTIRGLPTGSLIFVEAVHEGRRAEHEPVESKSIGPGQTFPCDLTLDARATVRGLVHDEAGEPVERVPVMAFLGEDGFDRITEHSDASGRYEIDGLPAGRVVLKVGGSEWSRPGAPPLRQYDSDGSPGVPLEIEHDGQVLTADLEVRRGVCVEGHVVDGSGRAVAGAVVLAQCIALHSALREDAWPRRRTDEAGVFVFAALRPGDDWRFDATASGARSVPLTAVRITGEEPVRDLVLEVKPTANLAGRVVDADGVPQAGLGVQLEEEDVAALTDAQGAFTFSRLFAGTHSLSVRAEALGRLGLPFLEMSIELAPGEAQTGLVITTEHTLSVAGTVVDGTGQPVANSLLLLQPVDRYPAMPTLASTDDEGRFRCAGLKPGRYRANVDGVPIDVEIRAGDEDVRLVLKRQETWTLRGRVLAPDGTVVSQARVRTAALSAGHWWHSPSGEVRDGVFEVSVPMAVPSVSVEVNDAVAADGAKLAVMPWKRESVTADDNPLEIHLTHGCALAGRVVDSEGHPIPGVKLFGASPTDDHYPDLLATTDAEGRFDVPGLAPGAVRLRFLPPRGWGMPDDRVVTPGEATLNVVLEKSTPFEGQVVDEEGRGVAAAVVALTDGASEVGADFDFEFTYAHVPWVLTDRQGRFSIRTVRRGTYDVTVGVPPRRDGAPWPFLRKVVEDVPTSETPIRIPLVRGVFIEVEVYESDGTPARDGRVWVEPAPPARSDYGRTAMEPVAEDSHRHRSGALPPGTYLVQARRHEQALESERVEVVAPATGVRLQFKRALEIRGRLDGAGGERFKLQFRATDGSRLRARGRARPDGTFVIGVEKAVAGVLYASQDEGDRYALLEGVVPGRGPLVLRVEKGLRIHGRLPDGADVESLVFVRVYGDHGLSWHASLDDDGTFEVRGLPPGRYDLRAMDGLGRHFAQSDVAAGSRDVVVPRVSR